MANALAKTEAVDVNGMELTLTLYVAFSGPEVSGGLGTLAYVTVGLAAGDSAVVIRQKMAAAVSDAATALGFAVAGTNMTLPTFQKG